MLFRIYFQKKNRAVFNQEIKQITKEALKISPQSIIASLEGMKIRKDQTKLLKNSMYPKLIILGKKDPVLEANLLRKQAKGTTIKLVEFPDGHMSHIENTDLLINTLQDFVKICN